MMSFIVLSEHQSVRDIRESAHSCPPRLTLVLTWILSTKINPKGKGGGQECPPYTKVAKICRRGDPHRGRCGSMKFHTEYLTLHTKTKRAYIHLSPQVESALKKSGIKDGMILVSAMHITAGVYVNDNESGLIKDIDQWLETLAPFRQNYQHHQTGEDNGDAHLKSLIIHHEVIVPVTNGKLDFGPWQQIFYAEFDGQRDKRVIIKVMGE
jgi:secondary thiamine-phosphate synthase enzyme